MIVYELLTRSAFFDFVHHYIFLNNMMFRKPVLLPSSGNEAPNLMDLLFQAILSHFPVTENSLLHYLKMEAEPTFEMSCCLKSFRQWTKFKKRGEDCFSVLCYVL